MRNTSEGGELTEENQAMLAAGTPAPDFDLQDQSGHRVRLSDQRGKWLTFWWYPEAGSGGCSLQVASLTARAAEFEAMGVALIGISFNDVAKNNEFSCDYDVPFPLLSDTGRKTGRAYDVVRQPDEPFPDKPRRITYLIDPSGRIAFGELVPSDDLKSYATRVLAQLRSVMTAEPAAEETSGVD